MIDLSSLETVGSYVSPQSGLISLKASSACNVPSVSRDYVAFGDGSSSKARLFDRHHGVVVATFEHADEDGEDECNRAAVSHVALSDEAGIAVTTGNDKVAKVWISREAAARIKSQQGDV